MRDMAKGKQKGAKKPKGQLTLWKPMAISGRQAWFEEYYVPGSQHEGDRKLFSQ